MIPPEKDTLKAMVELDHNQYWQQVVAWIRASRDAYNARWPNQTDDAELHRSQGAARQLSEIVRLVDEAKDRFAAVLAHEAEQQAEQTALAGGGTSPDMGVM